MLRLSARAAAESTRSIVKGVVYEPVDKSRLLLNVAIKDANKRLKFVMMRFEGKYF